MNGSFKLRALSSLAKVFADEYPPYREIQTLSGFQNEPLSFQIAYCHETEGDYYRDGGAEVTSELSVSAYTVALIPSNMPVYPAHDGFVLRDKAGLFPDLLRPYAGTLPMPPKQWRSVWFELEDRKPAGEYPVRLCFARSDGEVLGEICVTVRILPADLPESGLICTNWFHTDCLSTWYQAPVFSERYWEIVERYASAAARHGVNMLLTPLFTPPLDTEVGGERPTVQLVDVVCEDGAYRFGFEKLERWIAMCDRVGIAYFELAHFFTQWGAAHAPKIMAEADGEYRQIFGWDTDSAGEAYTDFLRAFAAAFVRFAEEKGIRRRCILHVSDEPSMAHLDAYSARAELIRSLFPGFQIIDALSNAEFYDSGAVTCPVPADDHIEPFLERGIEGLWTYYCCGQYRYHVPNRFFCMPSMRNRVLGFLLYKYRMKGFLQWGFNFWYSQLSRYAIDPFTTTDADYAFPSGDAFVVYPGEDGAPLCSLRLKVFREALNDLRALLLLESRIGREAVLELLEAEGEISFRNYPHSDEWLLCTRERINQRFLEAIAPEHI